MIATLSSRTRRSLVASSIRTVGVGTLAIKSLNYSPKNGFVSETESLIQKSLATPPQFGRDSDSESPRSELITKRTEVGACQLKK